MTERCAQVAAPPARNAREQRRQLLVLAWQHVGQMDAWRSAEDSAGYARDYRLGGNGRDKESLEQAKELRRLLGHNPFAPPAPPSLF